MNYLPRAFDSAIAQSYKNIEILISDNASTDGTQEYCAQLKTRYTSVRYFRQQENLGPESNFEFLIKNVLGKYILILADDDYLEPEAIEDMLSLFQEQSEVVHVGCYYNEITPDGRFRLNHSYDDLVDLKSCLKLSAINDYAQNSRLAVLVYGLTRTDARRNMPKKLSFRAVDLSKTSSGTEIVMLRYLMLRGSIGIIPRLLINYTGPGERCGEPSQALVLSHDFTILDGLFIEIQRFIILARANLNDRRLRLWGLGANYQLVRSFLRHVGRRFAHHASRYFLGQRSK